MEESDHWLFGGYNSRTRFCRAEHRPSSSKSSFNLRDTGSHVPDRPRVVGMLFCIGLLTVGSRLCVFCSLHFRTLRDHCRATTRNISDILNSATSSLRSSSRAFASQHVLSHQISFAFDLYSSLLPASILSGWLFAQKYPAARIGGGFGAWLP